MTAYCVNKEGADTVKGEESRVYKADRRQRWTFMGNISLAPLSFRQPTPEKLGGSSWQGGKVGREIRCLTKLEECDLDWRFDGCILICVCVRARVWY